MARHDRETVRVLTKEATRMAVDRAFRTGLIGIILVIGALLLALVS